MKEGWEVKKLGELTEIITKGTTPKTLGYNYTDEGINFIKVESITETGTFLIDNFAYVSNDCHKALLRSQLEENDLLFSIAGALGRTAIVSKSILPANTNQAVAIIRLVDKSELFLRYLQYYFKSNRVKEHINSIKVGVAQMNLSLGQLKDFLILVPPLPEQSRIVEELDQLSNIIEKKRQQLSELDNLAQSIFYDMFGDPVTNEKGWEVKKIGEISTFYNGKAHEKNIVEFSEILLVNAKFISSNGVIKKYSDIQLFPLYKNDITMVMSDLPNGRTLAKCYLIEKDDAYTLNQRICAFRGYKQNPIFLKYVLNRNKYYLSFDDGNGQTNLRKSDVVNCPVIIPPLSLQQLFAQKIEAIEKEKELIKQSIKATEELFNSRMDYYFS